MTGIQWTNETWNPTTGCDRVSPGCDNCYAMAMAKRLKGMGQPKYQRDGDPRTSGPGFGPTVHPDTLDLPLRWRKPRRVFVNSMSDLFHDKVPDGFIARVWAVMAATPRHTYQVLTKRHGRMRSLLDSAQFEGQVEREVYDRSTSPCDSHFIGVWPLPNVHLGVSVEDQKRADLRIPALLDTPAAVRFISAEPLLGPVDLHGPADSDGHRPKLTYWLMGRPGDGPEEILPSGLKMSTMTVGPKVDWVIAGGESGPGARPCDPEWIRALIKQCQSAGVPVFVKQLGSRWAQSNGWGGKGGLPEQWPEDLRVREFPRIDR